MDCIELVFFRLVRLEVGLSFAIRYGSSILISDLDHLSSLTAVLTF